MLSTPPKVQPTLEAIRDRSTQWAFNDPRARKVHKAIMEMIALDDEPFRLVQHTGFQRLLKILEPRYTLPGMMA